MDTKTATLIAAAVGLGAEPALASSLGNAAAVPVAASYAELLTPIPNAVERLKLADHQAREQRPELMEVQYVPFHDHNPGPNRHHHHHNRKWYLSNGYYWHNGGWVMRPRAHHHHHHHHDHN